MRITPVTTHRAALADVGNGWHAKKFLSDDSTFRCIGYREGVGGKSGRGGSSKYGEGKGGTERKRVATNLAQPPPSSFGPKYSSLSDYY